MATSLENLASKTSFPESVILPPPRNEVETWESPRSHEEIFDQFFGYKLKNIKDYHDLT